MAAYHQMGHHTANLVLEDQLKSFAGVILSPVNEGLSEVTVQVADIREARGNLDVLFDPQLYVPQSQRGQLQTWPYFPSAVDTADLSQLQWWQPVLRSIAQTALPIKPNGICSPAFLPRQFTDEYFDLMVRLGSEMDSQVRGSGVRSVQAIVVDMAQLADSVRCLEIASVVSRSKILDLYLIFQTDTPPRREIRDGDMVRGGMTLIHALRNTGYRVLVGCTGADMVLWKAAGATSCASGKFFNLRRFTRSRWDEPSEGGQNLPYWFEENLLAFVRESDLVRLRKKDKLSAQSVANPYGKEILNALDYNYSRPPPEVLKPWIGLGWRQYMYWFADMENRISAGLSVEDALLLAETNWLQLQDEKFLMDEARNDGAWVRPWRRALSEFQEPLR